MLIWEDLQGGSKILHFLLCIFKAVSVKCCRLKCMFSISRTPVKNLLHTVLDSSSRNLEVSSHLFHNLKSIFMKLLITLVLKNTCFFAGIYVTYSQPFGFGRESTSLPFALWDVLKGRKGRGGTKGFFLKKNNKQTPQQHERFNYSSELHEILRIAS